MQTVYVGNVPHDFPDSMSEDQISAALRSEYPAPVEKHGVDALADNVNSAGTAVGHGLQAVAESGPMKFLGNLGGLVTSVPNAAIQGIQDKGFGPSGLLESGLDVGRAIADPFIPGQNPTQSTATSLKRMGVNDTPTQRMKQNNLGQWVPGIPDVERQQDGRNPDGSIKYVGPDQGMSPGLATGLGQTIDLTAGLVGPGELGALSKVAGIDRLAGAASDIAKERLLAGRAADVLNHDIAATPGQIRHGYTKEVLDANGIGGSLENGQRQVNDLMALYGGDLNRALQAAPTQNRVDALQLVANMNKPMMSELDANKVQDELTAILQNTGDGSGVLSIPDANVFKQKVGQLAYDNGRSIEPSGIKQELYDAVRGQTRAEIERQAAGMGPEVAAANAKLSPLFSVQSALNSRLGGLDPATRPGMFTRMFRDATGSDAVTGRIDPGAAMQKALTTGAIEAGGHLAGVPLGVTTGLLAAKKIGSAALNEMARMYAADPAMPLLARSFNVSKDIAIRAAILSNITGKAIGESIQDVSLGVDTPENHIQ